MYYVLFHYNKGQKGKDFRGCRSEDDVINFLHDNHKKIEILKIIEVNREYRLGLVVSEYFGISGPDITQPSTGMSKIAEEIDKEIKEDEDNLRKNKEALERADKAIAAAKELEDKKKDWQLCSKCQLHKVAPWNKKGICSSCQRAKKSKKGED